MSKTKITDISSLLQAIDNVKARYPDNELFFRGQDQKYKNIQPAISRDGFLAKEDVLFRESMLRNPDEFSNLKTTFEKLTRMQHYKLPTRLLDVTTNPLVALFFAATSIPNKDGSFIIFAIPRSHIKYYDSDTVSVVSNIAKRPSDKLDVKNLGRNPNESEEGWIRRFNEHEDIRYLLHEIKDEKPYFQPIIIKEHLESIWCVKPLMNNKRIIKQDGAFLLFGIKGSKEQIAGYDPAAFEPLEYPVEKGRKGHLRILLEGLGISKDKLFPELDTTSEYLRDKYGKP